MDRTSLRLIFFDFHYSIGRKKCAHAPRQDTALPRPPYYGRRPERHNPRCRRAPLWAPTACKARISRASPESTEPRRGGRFSAALPAANSRVFFYGWPRQGSLLPGLRSNRRCGQKRALKLCKVGGRMNFVEPTLFGFSVHYGHIENNVISDSSICIPTRSMGTRLALGRASERIISSDFHG